MNESVKTSKSIKLKDCYEKEIKRYPVFVSEKVIADDLGLVAKKTLQKQRWRKGKKDLPFYKVGRSVKYNLREVFEWLMKQNGETE